MSFLKRIYLGITRRPFRSFSLILIIIIISLFGMTGNYLRTTVASYESIIYQQLGLQIGLSYKNENKEDIPNSIIEKIAKESNVIGFNASFLTLVDPVNFVNAIDRNNENAFTMMENQRQVRLIGNINASFYETFQRKDMKLIAGNFPDEKQPGILIDEFLAVKNNLQIGSEVQILNSQNNKMNLIIVGIYQTLVTPEINWVSGSGQNVYGESPYSYLFCDINSYNKVSIEPTQLNFVSFYVNDIKNLNITLQSIKRLPIDWSEFKIENITQSTIEQSSQVIQVLSNTAKFVLAFSYISATGILFLITLLWMRDHLKETGIYVALGTNRFTIVLHFFMEVFLISIFGLLISSSIGFILIQNFKEDIIHYSLSFSLTPIIIHNNDETNVIGNSLSISSFIMSNFYFLAITCITTLISSCVILRYNPRHLFNLK